MVTTRNRTIDSIKGICTILVIFTHYTWTSVERLKWLFPYWVDMAVPVFMIISGYVGAQSFERQHICYLEQAYGMNNLCKRILRFACPFTIVFIAQEILRLVRGGGTDCSVASYVFSSAMRYLIGGEGPGSYYFPIMLQFVFIFPIVYILIRNLDKNGVFVCFAISGIFEVLQKAYGMGTGCYRLLLFRYIFFIAIGTYYAIGRKKFARIWQWLLFVAGAFFVFLFSYTGYQPCILDVQWKQTCFLTGLYIAPLFGILLKCDLHIKPLELIGKASFNIFLVQGTFFIYAGFVYNRISHRIMQLLLTFTMCLIGGLLFHILEVPLTRQITKRVEGVLRRIYLNRIL